MITFKEDHYAEILHCASDAILCVDRKQLIVFANERAAAVFGCTAAELEGASLATIIPEKYRAQHADLVRAFIEGETSRRAMTERREVYGLRKDGTEFPAEVTISKCGHGTSLLLIAIVRDLSERKERDTLFKKLMRAVEQSATAIIFTDREGVIEYVNPRFSDMTGYSLDEALGHTPRILKSGNMPSSFYEGMWSTISSGREFHGEIQNKRKDGELYWELITVSPITSAQGEITHYLATAEDITLKKQLEQKLQQTLERLKDSNKEMGQFTSVVSHDIRSPLATISAGIEFTLDEYASGLDPQGVEMLRASARAAQHLQELVSDLLSYSRVDRQFPELEPVELDSIVDAVLLHLACDIDERQAAITKKVTGTVRGTRTLVFQLFLNLIGNALKYCDKTPQVTIRAESKGECCSIVVCDNGIGIRREDLERIFLPFERAVAKSQYSGTGIGLATCKRVADRLGGAISVTSEPGKGSEFLVTLPVWQES